MHHYAQIIEYLTYFQTSSPSYLVMSSLEYAQSFYEEFESELFFEKENIHRRTQNERF